MVTSKCGQHDGLYDEWERPMLNSNATVTEWVQLVRAEYLEMPGLHLTKEQVGRLWGLDAPTCEALIDSLVSVGFLRRTRSAGYVRADTG